MPHYAKRRAELRSPKHANLEDKNLASLRAEVSQQVAQGKIGAAIAAGQQAAIKFGAAGFYLLHQAELAKLAESEALGEATEREGVTALTHLMCAQQLCQQHQSERESLQKLAENVDWQKLQNSLIEEYDLENSTADAQANATLMSASFDPQLEEIHYTPRQKLQNAILPARVNPLSENEKELYKLSNAAAQKRDPALKIEAQTLSNGHGTIKTTWITHGTAPQRILIHCRGNGEHYEALQAQFIQQAKALNALVIGFNYPSVGGNTPNDFNADILRDAVLSIVEQALEQTGLAPEELTLIGQSLGGAIATTAAADLHKRNIAVRLVNSRSLATLNILAHSRQNFLSGFTELLADNPDLNIDAASAYQSLPETHKMLICAADDPVIPHEASLLECLNLTDEEKADAMFAPQHPQVDPHSCSLRELVDHLGERASDRVATFITRELPHAQPTSQQDSRAK